MRILALYLKEETQRKIRGRKKSVWRIPATDVQIIHALKSLGHVVERKAYDPGKVLRLDKKYDVIFNLCDGLEYDTDFVEFSALRELEKTGIPFTGNNLKTVQLCNDKRKIKKKLLKHNILTPEFQIFRSEKQQLRSGLRFPLIVKPVCADAAVGIYADSVVKDERQLRRKIKRVLVQHDQPAALVEEYIDGRDLTIPVMGKRKVEVFAPIEVRYFRSYKRRPKIMSYAAKWHKKKPIYKDYAGLIKNPEKRFSRKQFSGIKSVVEKVYQIMGCDGYATVDARLKGDELFVIEVNPNCWIGKKSDFAYSLKKAHQISYAGFINRVVKTAIER